MKDIFVYVLKYMLSLVSLDKMQNICTFMRKSLKSEGRAFYFYWRFEGGTCLVDHLCYFCIVLVMLSRLLVAALWSSAGKGLTSWLSFVVLNRVVVTFPFGIMGLVWYLIVSIPNLCPLSYFHTVCIVIHISAVLVQ